MISVCCFVFQESVVTTLGARLDNETLETLTLAEQLSTNLTDLNIRIEGTYILADSHFPLPNAHTGCKSHTGITVSVNVNVFACVCRDDPRLGAVQCSAGRGPRGGETQHRQSPGNADQDEETGPVPTRACCHRRVHWGSWLWVQTRNMTEEERKKKHPHTVHTITCSYPLGNWYCMALLTLNVTNSLL